jgi:DNA (cytosine-5)-methyltransferase 1
MKMPKSRRLGSRGIFSIDKVIRLCPPNSGQGFLPLKSAITKSAIRNQMTHGSLFSGIGGFDLAAEWMGWENLFHCEIDQRLRAFLKSKWPGSKSFENIQHADFNEFRGKIDMLTGGFPCQNISTAGNKEGLHGAKSSLWFEFYRAITSIHPRFVLIENSNQLSRKGLEIILLQLAESGYDAQWETFRASEFGHDHYRPRTYILAHTSSHRWEGLLYRIKAERFEKIERSEHTPLDTYCHPFLRFTESTGKSVLFGMDDGISGRVDVVHRLGACGNAVVPQIPYAIFQAIEATEKNM